MWVRPGTTWLSLPSLARLLYHTISACVVLTAHGVSSCHGYKISSDSILLCSSRAYLLVYVQQWSVISCQQDLSSSSSVPLPNSTMPRYTGLKMVTKSKYKLIVKHGHFTFCLYFTNLLNLCFILQQFPDPWDKGRKEENRVPHQDWHLSFSLYLILSVLLKLSSIKLNSLQAKLTQHILNSTELCPVQLRSR